MNPLLVLRVGYMQRYDGPDTITSGGKIVEETGIGGEVYNFKPSRGKCYGYAMSGRFAGINLGFIDSSRKWQQGDKLSGVDVVFIAVRPGHGQVVVGWYRDATVFHKEYRTRRGRIAGIEDAKRHYLCTADQVSVTLLPEDDRTFSIRSAQAGNNGFPGMSHVWYPARHLDRPEVVSFVRRLRKFIEATPAQKHAADESADSASVRRVGQTRGPDAAHNAAVEMAAEEAAWRHYEKSGYTVQDVSTENLGWDFVATKGRNALHVEVKGVSGPDIYFELTPNEYANLQKYEDRYRVCVVCDALTTPRLYELKPERWESGWGLSSKSPATHVPLRERIAAVGVEVAMDSLKP